jgi:hypothetical protein
MAIGPEDPELLTTCLQHGIRPTMRSKESVKKGAPFQDIFGFVKDLDATHFLWVNACHPFLRVGTVIDAARTFETFPEIKSMTSVVPEKSYFWDDSGVPVSQSDDIRTDKASLLFKCAHAFHIWPKELMLEKGRPWGYTGPDDPRLFELWNAQEALDVDSEEDFNIVKDLYRAQIQKPAHS